MRREFRIGLVEGFYGRQWSWQARLDNIRFLSTCSYKEYLYAPKGDVFLRKRWFEDWPAKTKAEISLLIDIAHKCGLTFSLGISPLGYSVGEVQDSNEKLLKRLESFVSLGVDCVYLLFDDMKGDDPELAKNQSDIVTMVRTSFPKLQLGFCPSYYSDDPMLDKVFGQRPKHYLEQLGELIDPAVEIFWTGEQVCSASYSEEHILRVTSQLRRKPLLWDNYPVNDGEKLCGKLHLLPVTGRPAALRELLSGHMANPMNQPVLSRLPLQSLADNYFDPAYDADTWFSMQAFSASEKETALLKRDCQRFATEGLWAMSEQELACLKAEYRNVGEFAVEVFDWLDGGYVFDPGCLT